MGTRAGDHLLQEALRREITRRHRRRQKQPFSMPALRCAELNKLFRARYGLVLPDDDAGRADARIMAHHLAGMSGDPRRRIDNWLDVHAPWLVGEERDKLLAEIEDKRRKWRAEKLAQLVRLTEIERPAATYRAALASSSLTASGKSLPKWVRM